MRHCSGSQTDQDEVLDDCCHVNSALETLHSEGHVITIAFFFGRELRSAWNCPKKWRFGEKPPNPMRETEEENREITENILAL